MNIYVTFKYLHVMLAIIAVGFSASYSIWINRAAHEPENLKYILRGVRFLDSRFTNPAFLGLLLFGLGMAWYVGLPLTTLWIGTAIALYFAVALLGILVYAPIFRQLVGTIETRGVRSSEFQILLRRSNLITLFLGVIMLLVVFLMVFKPTT